MFDQLYDLAVIGGGLNGAAVARDAAGRGLSVFLCEEGDIGGGNASATGKLVHGGIGYLEGLRLGAMREAVAEREILMHAAPHLLRPARFLIPHHARMASRSALRLGLFALDRVARSRLPPSSRVDLEADDAPAALQAHFTTAFAYWDCVADDSRLTVLNVIDARTRGASVNPRLRCIVAEREGGRWRLSLESTLTGEQSVVHAGILVNAAGAAATDVHNHVVHSERPVRARYTRSAFIVVQREDAEALGYALADSGGRLVYAFPWQPGTMLIGPAVRAVNDGASTEIERRDVAALAEIVAQYFDVPLAARDIVWSFAAVTAMPAEAPARHERAVVVDAPPRGAPLVSVFGGTLTGHRRLAEQVVDGFRRFREVPPPWTARAALPGGGFPTTGGADLVRALRAAYPFVSEAHAARLVGAYGTRASSILTGARSSADLGIRFGGDLTEAEVNYLRNEEWALTAEDVLWRRSKLGLAFTEAEAAALAEWMDEKAAVLPPA